MVRWINNRLGTSTAKEADPEKFNVVDVRDLVDGKGNDTKSIMKKINEAISFLKENKKVVINCEYGISRSNAIAIGVLSKYGGVNFNKAAKIVMNKIGETEIRLDTLNSVKKAITNVVTDNNAETYFITNKDGFLSKTLISSLSNEFNIVDNVEDDDYCILQSAITIDLHIKENKIGTLIHVNNPKSFTNKNLGQSLSILKNIIDACLENNTRLIFISNASVYSGYKDQYILADETTQLNPKGVSGEIYFLSEKLINNYREKFDLKASIIRIGCIYDPNLKTPKVLAIFKNQISKNKDIITHNYTNGFPILDLISASDVINFLRKYLKKKKYDDINLGAKDTHTTFEIAKLMKKYKKSSIKIDFKEIKNFCSNVVLDNKRAKDVFNWAPSSNFKDALKTAIQRKDKTVMRFD